MVWSPVMMDGQDPQPFLTGPDGVPDYCDTARKVSEC